MRQDQQQIVVRLKLRYVGRHLLQGTGFDERALRPLNGLLFGGEALKPWGWCGWNPREYAVSGEVARRIAKGFPHVCRYIDRAVCTWVGTNICLRHQQGFAIEGGRDKPIAEC